MYHENYLMPFCQLLILTLDLAPVQAHTACKVVVCIFIEIITTDEIYTHYITGILFGH